MRGLPTFIQSKIPRLAQQLSAEGGLLLFEYLAEVALRPYYFPEGKRLLNGLSELTVLFEASEKSGSLINARLAVKQGPYTCAVLGPVTSPLSVGSHRLFRQGAVLVICVAEVAEELGWSLARSANATELARD